MLSRPYHRKNQDPVKEPIVLKVNMVDDEQAGGKEDREACDMRKMFAGARNGLDISIVVYVSPLSSGDTGKEHELVQGKCQYQFGNDYGCTLKVDGLP